MRARRVIGLLVALVGYYVFVVSSRGLTLLRDERLAFRGLGLGLLLLGLVGALVVVGEVRLARAGEQLAREAGKQEPLDFERAKSAVESSPDDWRAWWALAESYGAAGDTGRARCALRTAVRLRRAAT